MAPCKVGNHQVLLTKPKIFAVSIDLLVTLCAKLNGGKISRNACHKDTLFEYALSGVGVEKR